MLIHLLLLWAALTAPKSHSDQFEYVNRIIFRVHVVHSPAQNGFHTTRHKKLIIERRDYWFANRKEIQELILDQGADFPILEVQGPYRRLTWIESNSYGTKSTRNKIKILRLKTRSVLYCETVEHQPPDLR